MYRNDLSCAVLVALAERRGEARAHQIQFRKRNGSEGSLTYPYYRLGPDEYVLNLPGNQPLVQSSIPPTGLTDDHVILDSRVMTWSEVELWFGGPAALLRQVLKPEDSQRVLEFEDLSPKPSLSPHYLYHTRPRGKGK